MSTQPSASLEALEPRTLLSASSFYFDTFAPTAALGGGAITGGKLEFTVSYSDDTEVDLASIADANISVTGPDGFLVPVRFENIRPGAGINVTYSFGAPGGDWQSWDMGTYTVSSTAYGVRDLYGNTVTASTLGTFDVEAPATGLPDLVPSVGAITAAATLAGGETFSAQVLVNNDGDAASDAYADLLVYALGSGGYTLLQTVPNVHFALGSGHTLATPVSLTIPTNLPSGSYKLAVALDLPGNMPDSDRLNNFATDGRTVTVAQVPADLTVGIAGMGLNVVSVPGESGKVGLTVTNAGGSRVAGKTAFAVYASLDSVLDSGDVLMGKVTRRIDLAAGASCTVWVNATIPTDMDPSSFHLLAVADADGKVAEVSEANNTAISATALDSVWKFGNFSGRRNVKLALKDAGGRRVAFSMSGNGVGEVTEASGKWSLALAGTDSRTNVTISNPDGASLENITCAGNIRSLSAGHMDITGAVTISGGAETLTFDDMLAGSSIDLNQGASDKRANITLDQATSLTIASDNSLRTVKATQWLTGGTITAPSMDKLNVTGNGRRHLAGQFFGDLILSGAGVDSGKSVLGSASIAGDVEGSLWDIGGVMGKVTVGGTLRGSEIRSDDSMLGLTLGASDGSNVLVGVAGSVVGRATDAGDFVNALAQLKSLTVKGLAKRADTRYFINTNISAPNLGTVRIANPKTDGGSEFGFYVGALNGNSIKFDELATKAVGYLTGGENSGDLWVRVY